MSSQDPSVSSNNPMLHEWLTRLRPYPNTGNAVNSCILSLDPVVDGHKLHDDCRKAPKFDFTITRAPHDTGNGLCDASIGFRIGHVSCVYTSKGDIKFIIDDGSEIILSDCRSEDSYKYGDTVGFGFLRRRDHIAFRKNDHDIKIMPLRFITTLVELVKPQMDAISDILTTDEHVRRSPAGLENKEHNTTLPAAGRRFPPEIIHWILVNVLAGNSGVVDLGLGPFIYEECLQRYQLAIAMVSSVCRRWYIVSRPLRFRTIALFTPGSLRKFLDTVNTPLRLTTGITPSIGSFIHLLQLDRAASEHMWHILLSTALRRLVNLKALIWHAGNNLPFAGKNQPQIPPHVASVLPSLFRNFTTVTSFALHSHEFPSFRRLAQLVSSFPSLVTLVLNDVSWRGENSRHSPPSWPCHPVTLRSVDMKWQSISKSIPGPICATLLWFFIGPAKRHPSSDHAVRRLLPQDAAVIYEMFAINTNPYKTRIEMDCINATTRELTITTITHTLTLILQSDSSSLSHVTAMNCVFAKWMSPRELKELALLIAAFDGLDRLSNASGVVLEFYPGKTDDNSVVRELVKQHMPKMCARKAIIRGLEEDSECAQ